MNLPADPVRSMEDVTLNFEQLQTVLTKPGSQLPFLQLLASKQAQVAYGSDTVTFTASVSSATKTITHSLGRTPAFVVGQGTSGIWVSPTTLTTTQATFQGSFYTATTGTFTFYWLAIG